MEKLWNEMYLLTSVDCPQCELPCCSVEYCDITEEYALSQDISLQKTTHSSIPFMGPEGCIVNPALRPLCTIHTCSRKPLSERYWDLRDLLSDSLKTW